MSLFFSPKFIVGATLATAALGAATVAEARPEVYFSIGLQSGPAWVGQAPVVVLPQPVYVQPAPVYMRPPVFVSPRKVFERMFGQGGSVEDREPPHRQSETAQRLQVLGIGELP